MINRPKQSLWEWSWVSDYSDVSDCIELAAVYDDALKKDDTFTSYAIMLANRIIEVLKIKGQATWGKWGARLEMDKNEGINPGELEDIATQIVRHPSWQAFRLSTHVFTYGEV